MKFSILLTGTFVFIICLFLHIIIWRWRYPKKRNVALFLIFIIIPTICIIAIIGINYFIFLSEGIKSIHFATSDWLAVYLLHFALSLAYILSYPAVEAVSPSLSILLMLGASNHHGMLCEDLLHVFDDEVVLEPRIQDLIESGLVVKSDGYLTVTLHGSTFVKCFILLRHVLGLPIGKG